MAAPHVEPAADEILVRAAWYYYKDQLTQAEVAERLGVSRASIGRLLDRARETGVVRIDIDPRHLVGLTLARRLAERFRLDDAVVVPEPHGVDEESQQQANTRVAQGAAQFLTTALPHAKSLGIGYGDTVARTLSWCNRSLFDDLAMVTLTGGINAYLYALDQLRNDGYVQWVSSTQVIPTPIFASSAELAGALSRDASVSEALAAATDVDVAVAGIGGVVSSATLVRWGFQAQDDIDALRDRGFVGDVLGMFFDEDGTFRETELTGRRIGIDPDRYLAIPNRVGIAAGSQKVDAIRGALNGRLFTTLVTSERLANELLDGS